MRKTILAAFVSSWLIAGPAALRADTAANYARYCAQCHGSDGAGHTRAGRMVKVKDMTDAQYQKSFTDGAAFKALKDGLQAPDGRTEMKPVGDKLSDAEITALVAYVRTLAR